jgi:prephenate dehydrogenase
VETVAIFGVGLIGGSFAAALRKIGFEGEILGVGSPGTLARAVERELIHRGVTEREAAGADLILLAQPVKAILAVLPRLAEWVRDDALVTDAGSTKAAIAAAGEAALGPRFLGGHPLAGKASRGLDAADPDLFRGHTWIFTPHDASRLETPAAKQLLALLREMGATAQVLSAGEHDHVLALTSHLPQLAATALSVALSSRLSAGRLAEERLFGPGLLDSTRLALSPFSVWGDILSTNSGEIRAALNGYINALTELRSMLESGSPALIERTFNEASEFASGIRRRQD